MDSRFRLMPNFHIIPIGSMEIKLTAVLGILGATFEWVWANVTDASYVRALV